MHLESCLNPKLRAVCDALLHCTDHAQTPRTGSNLPMRLRVLYLAGLNFKHDFKSHLKGKFSSGTEF